MPEKLKKAHIRALKAISLHFVRFQPLQLRAGGVHTEVADQLVGLGLAEYGECDPHFEAWGYPTGYRLTPAGWRFLSDRTSRTYFGLWSAAKIQRATDLLRSLDVRFEVQEIAADRNTLEEWSAWDPAANDPYIGYDLWIRTTDLPKVGHKIVEAFPERKFGAT